MNTNIIKEKLLKIHKYKKGDFYLGSLATSKAMYIMGFTYGRDSWIYAVNNTDSVALLKAYEYLKSYIDYMDKNPIKICPCCGHEM